MKNKSQILQTVSTAGQLGLLIAGFVLVGFVLPIYAAPYIADKFPITTPYEAARETMSVRIDNRNAVIGDTFTVGVSDPASAVRVRSFSYACSSAAVTLAYMTDGSMKRIPCDTPINLPDSSQHALRVLESPDTLTHVPITLRLENEDRVGEITLTLATAGSDADGKSSLSDTTTATLQSFPAEKR